MERLESAGLKVNRDKSKLRESQKHFLGQVINKGRVRPHPAKVSAINALNPPEDVQQLKRALGMINYWGNTSLIYQQLPIQCMNCLKRHRLRCGVQHSRQLSTGLKSFSLPHLLWSIMIPTGTLWCPSMPAAMGSVASCYRYMAKSGDQWHSAQDV